MIKIENYEIGLQYTPFFVVAMSGNSIQLLNALYELRKAPWVKR
jgi:hypothetical protein